MALMKRTRATALDRDPLDEKKLDALLVFLKDRLSPEDFSKLTDMIDDVVDDAETANPSKAMATDAMSISTRRIIRRIERTERLGLSKQTGGMAYDAARAAAFDERFGTARIRSDPMPGMAYTPPRPQPEPTQPAARAAKEASDARVAAMMGGRTIRNAD
jgi:hypothetical protein